ncbi:MAG: D-alanyl-D-alanine carboxypeptidase/D-alanyl-D-alanine endopeptidase [Phycisphaerales bacterium]
MMLPVPVPLACWRQAALAVLTAVLVAPIAAAQLATDLRTIVDRIPLGEHGIAGIAIYDLGTGAPLFEHNASVPLAPASNQKLLTSAAATKILGPAFVFETAVYRTSDGSLAIVGTGDPAFGDLEVLRERDPARDPDDVLRTMAAAIADAVGSANEIIVDDRVFDRELIHPDWPQDQLEKWYCAPVQGVNVHANVLAFYPEPNGTAATAAIEPEADWIEVASRANVVSEGRNSIWIQRTESDDRFVLRGNIRTRVGAPIEVAVREPSLLAGKLLAERLEQAGVDGASVSRVRLAYPDEQLTIIEPALVAWVTPMAEVMYRCNFDSMNMYAEALLKRLGYEITGESGSWQNGAAVLRMLIADTLGAQAAAETVIRDGSGLSRENRVTADTMARWLVAMYRDPEVQRMYLATLPSYEDKLSRRLTLGEAGVTVHAKTGTINRVRCLSGYVLDRESGRGAAFAILCNELRTGESIRDSYRLKSEIIAAIDRHRMELVDPADFAAPPDRASGPQLQPR